MIAPAWKCIFAGMVLLTAALSLGGSPAVAAGTEELTRGRSAAIGDALIRTLTLRDYNTRVVVTGASLLGLAAGVAGTFAYLRKRALVSDALSHAMLPGIAGAFLLFSSKSLPVLLGGAAVTGLLGVGAILFLRRFSRLKEDAALGLVLGVFFGAGVVLLSVVQTAGAGNEAGLSRFLYGQAAAMIARDAMLMAVCAALALLTAVLLFKEFRLVCFDPDFAGALGRSVTAIDSLMMALVVLIVVVGLQAVGLILMVALLIIPAATARLWTDRFLGVTVLAGVFGAASAYAGASISALAPRLPTGAMIVVVAGTLFVISFLLAPQRGIAAAILRRTGLARRTSRQNVLRALAEFEEACSDGRACTLDDLRSARSWSNQELRRAVRRAERAGMIVRTGQGVRLTERGRVEARRILRNHRLWELYLIEHADIAPSHVDRDADDIEHVLGEDIVHRLERMLRREPAIPPSPHAAEAVP